MDTLHADRVGLSVDVRDTAGRLVATVHYTSRDGAVGAVRSGAAVRAVRRTIARRRLSRMLSPQAERDIPVFVELAPAGKAAA